MLHLEPFTTQKMQMNQLKEKIMYEKLYLFLKTDGL